jgi:putative membrane protein
MAQPPTTGGGGGGAGPGGGQSPAATPPTIPDTAAGPTADTTPRKVDDKKFAKDAALGGLTEVELGKLAAQKASNDAVKQFGQRMVDDHSKANDQLKQIAGKSNIDVPASLDSKHQSRVDKLAKLTGPAFDKAYVKDQLKDHERDVDDFKSEAQNGSDPNVKQFAMQTLPTLQEHLNAVKDLKKTVK